ncbi:TdeIII family type II restriction endonuclease [Sedimentisphaera salicampi]|uniref:type II site-specific deoxyribonuclease n=1 Tax=Sedimentisphaera salicampi TaxID=1941349 RepID=A0A1W6LIR4_9BACT|nr:TdeIII family type II restriction endonuclease [Sedimentisphaera salicampi]ARN55678.1 MjaII restriction endonuclease [Sedimentisphaera salicampi]
MALSYNQVEQIKQLLSEKIENKLSRYGRETVSMPFLARLIQDNEKIAAYSFIHSIATTLGMSIYEDVSVIIASERSQEAYKKYGVGGVLASEQKDRISSIVNELRNGSRDANIENEISEVLSASAQGGEFQKSGNEADFYMKRDGEEYFFEIKTVKPNIDVFQASKTKLLEWVARKRERVNVYLAFPYNPYHPEPYSRFTEVGMMDLGNDFLIGEQYWDFIGGNGTFSKLLEVFDEVGKYYKARLDKKFKEVAEKRLDSY